MRRASFLATVAAAFAFVGCGAGESAGPKKSVRGQIGVSVLTLTNPFFKEIADTIAAQAATHGYEVIAVSGQEDPPTQKNQIKDFIVKKVKAIVLCPCDSNAIASAIQEANDAGIPVFTADIACNVPGAKVVSHVATDNYGGGKLAAEAIVEALKGKGKVAILDYPEVESVQFRTKGFLERLAELNAQPGVEVTVVARQPGKGDKKASYDATQGILQAHPDIKGIFAINDPSALGAVAALEKQGRLGDIVVVGFDGQLEGKEAIKAGKIYADPIQFPQKIAANTVDSIIAYFDGRTPPAEVRIPTALYRKADAEKDPELKGR
jgi:ribose transport system substrate-binding protein